MLTLLLWSLFFVLIGAVIYNADLYYGTSWYGRWYNATHGEKLPENIRKGFVVGRSSKSRFVFAVFVVMLKVMATIVVEGGLHPLYEFLMWPVEVVSLVIGFYLGPFVYEQWRKKDKTFAYLDGIESGEVDLAGDLKRGAISVGDKAVNKVLSIKKRAGRLEKEKTPANFPESTVPEPKPDAKPPFDPEEAVRKFTSKF